MSELIRKWDAIYAVEGVDWYHINRNGELVKGANSKDHEPLYKAKDVFDALENVKPSQTEPLTDREQRIFLAAISREKEVCKEVDYQLSDAREPYEDTLVSVCKEIERKVKAALWMN